ncbi:MAG: class I SAM-dependent methyltransferase [Bdellovibrionaceae bacterium]|nr:class I SAM-dependent methyltransferase [Pseudobdellovibrionaceae bacterium]
MKCLLCQSPQTLGVTITKTPAGNYHHCQICDLIFMDPQERLSPEKERARYDLHDNQDTEGYRKFLEPVILQIDQYFLTLACPKEEVAILDYGCGQTAFFSKMLAERGYTARNYDVFFHTNQSVLQKNYDVIVSTEVWEHFYHPLEELEQLIKILKPHGLLAAMTSAHQGLNHFQSWYYRRDPTHVCFYSEITMKWISTFFKLKLIKADSPYWTFQENTP